MSVSPLFAAENRRYRALPLGGQTVFIMDTRDGNMWLWRGLGNNDVEASGENPSVSYQGNVQKNIPSSKNATQKKGKVVPKKEITEESRY